MQSFTSGLWTSPPRGIKTDAVLLLSDQVLFHPEDIRCAFRLWRLNNLVPVIGSEDAAATSSDEESAGLNVRISLCFYLHFFSKKKKKKKEKRMNQPEH